MGDISGLLSAHPRAPLVTLHHLAQLNPVFPDVSLDDGLLRLLAASRLLGSSFLQQTVSVNRVNRWTFSISEGYCIKWFTKAKFVPWAKSVEITFGRFLHKEHNGPTDWSFDSRRRLPDCHNYDVFFWAGLAADGLRNKYVRSDNPACSHFPTVQAIYVTLLPGTVHGRACETPAESALLSEHASIELCSTHATHLLEFSPNTGEGDADNGPQVLAKLREALGEQVASSLSLLEGQIPAASRRSRSKVRDYMELTR
jgi:hypothetical protein